MPYTQQQWHDDDTTFPYGPISGGRLNYIEAGIGAAQAAADDAVSASDSGAQSVAGSFTIGANLIVTGTATLPRVVGPTTYSGTATIPSIAGPTAFTGTTTLVDTRYTGTVQTAMPFAAQKKIQLHADDITGSVQRLIEFYSTNAEDRPWLSWFDENTRHVACTGYHTKLADSLGGNILKQFEIKTIASSTSSDPTDLRTRFAVQCDVQRGTWGVNYIDNFEIVQGENPILTTPGSATAVGLRIRTSPQDTATAGASNFVAAQFLAQIDTSDNVSAFIDCNVPYTTGGTAIPGNRSATLNFFRNTHTSSASSPQFAIKMGDGTNTNALLFTARSGLFELPLGTAGTTGIKLGGDANATLYRSATSTLKTDGKMTATLGLGCGNSASASTLGTLSKKMEVFDTAGASLGFVPIYTTIT